MDVEIEQDRKAILKRLRVMGIKKVVAPYSGGGDEGTIESIDLFDSLDETAEPVTSYCEDEDELAEALAKPIYDYLGDAWYDGEPGVAGVLIWLVEKSEIRIEHSWQEWASEEQTLHGAPDEDVFVREPREEEVRSVWTAIRQLRRYLRRGGA